MKLNILLVHNYYKVPGGEDTVVANEKELLESYGHKVRLYARSNQELEKFSFVQKLLLPFSSIFSLKTYREVKKLIREQKIDIVHVHNTLSLISPSVYYAAFCCHVPVVQTIHNFRMLCPAAILLRNGKICEECIEDGLKCAVQHGCYRNSKLQTLGSAAILKIHRMMGTYRKIFYICLTEFNREKLLSLNKNGKQVIEPENIFVKPNFVNVDKVFAETIKREHYIYVGRFDNLKGVRILLEAWKKFPDKKLLLCGSGGEEETWAQTYIERYGMKQVYLLGQQPRENVLTLLSESKALIVPTLCYEGQPMVILESYATGTPVLSSDIGNAGDMVVEGVTGLHFKTGDVHALQEVVEKFEKQTDKIWKTRDAYEGKYTPDKNYQLLMGIYRRIQEKSR